MGWKINSLIAVVFSMYYKQWQYPDRRNERDPTLGGTVKIVSKSALKSMNGKSGRPYYSALLGHVFDVSSDERFHEGHETGWYGAFVGRDSSRAWATGNLDEDRKDDVDKLDGGLLRKLDLDLADWKEKYAFVGILGGGFFYDAKGQLTLEGGDIDSDLHKERKNQAKKDLDKKRYPTCKDDGERKSCANGKLPRIRRSEGLRCCCVHKKVADKHDDDFVPLEDCAEEASSCTIVKYKHRL